MNPPSNGGPNAHRAKWYICEGLGEVEIVKNGCMNGCGDNQPVMCGPGEYDACDGLFFDTVGIPGVGCAPQHYCPPPWEYNIWGSNRAKVQLENLSGSNRSVLYWWTYVVLVPSAGPGGCPLRQTRVIGPFGTTVPPGLSYLCASVYVADWEEGFRTFQMIDYSSGGPHVDAGPGWSNCCQLGANCESPGGASKVCLSPVGP
jgi:hypothetical protein